MQGEIYKCSREMENGKAKGNGKDWVNSMQKCTTSTYVYYNTIRLFWTKNILFARCMFFSFTEQQYKE